MILLGRLARTKKCCVNTLPDSARRNPIQFSVGISGPVLATGPVVASSARAAPENPRATKVASAKTDVLGLIPLGFTWIKKASPCCWAGLRSGISFAGCALGRGS
jgi:hypothetical protein